MHALVVRTADFSKELNSISSELEGRRKIEEYAVGRAAYARPNCELT